MSSTELKFPSQEKFVQFLDEGGVIFAKDDHFGFTHPKFEIPNGWISRDAINYFTRDDNVARKAHYGPWKCATKADFVQSLEVGWTVVYTTGSRCKAIHPKRVRFLWVHLNAFEPYLADRCVALMTVGAFNGIFPLLPIGLRQTDKRFILELVTKDPCTIRILPMKWKVDVDVVKAALRKSGVAFQYVYSIFKSDVEMVLLAAKTDPYAAICHASKTWKNNPALILDLMLAPEFTHDWNFLQHVGKCFSLAGNLIHDDPHIARLAVECQPDSIVDVSLRLRQHYSFMRCAILMAKNLPEREFIASNCTMIPAEVTRLCSAAFIVREASEIRADLQAVRKSCPYCPDNSANAYCMKESAETTDEFDQLYDRLCNEITTELLETQ